MIDEAMDNEDARKQWHPVLVDGLRYLLGKTLRIEPEHAVSALPTRVDVLVMTPEPTAILPAPYDLLSRHTLVELVSPGVWATWRPLRKLYADAALYSLDQDIANTEDIGLWLVASRWSRQFLELARKELGPLDRIGPGIYQAASHGSRVVLIHLHELPLSIAAIPLLMVYQGPRENEIARFVIEQESGYHLFTEQAFSFHPYAVKEAMAMLEMTPEAFRRVADAKGIVDLFGTKILVEEMDKKDVIRAIGEEEVIRTIGEDRLRELLERMAKERKASMPDEP
jgi:hypothetical protein